METIFHTDNDEMYTTSFQIRPSQDAALDYLKQSTGASKAYHIRQAIDLYLQSLNQKE